MEVFAATGRLREHLNGCGVAELFDLVRSELAPHLGGAHQGQTANGVSFTISDPKFGKRVPLIGVFAGYSARGSSDSVAKLVSVSIAPPALDRGGIALEQLARIVDLEYWFHHGGQAFSIESNKEWNDIRPLIVDFVKTVMENLGSESRQH